MPAASIPLRVETHGNACVLTLDRQTARNAINVELGEALVDAMAAFVADDTLHAAVLVGAGGTFCAGGDFKELPLDAPDASIRDALVQNETVLGWLRAVERSPKPVIAAIDGHCIGLGVELAIAADIRLATPGATFVYPEARLGMLGGSAPFSLPRMLPHGEALFLALTGTPLSARRAYDLGFVQAVIDDPVELIERALSLAAQIGRGAPLSVQLLKQMMRGGVDHSAIQGFAAYLRPLLARTDDAAEAVAAFREGRTPIWRTR